MKYLKINCTLGNPAGEYVYDSGDGVWGLFKRFYPGHENFKIIHEGAYEDPEYMSGEVGHKEGYTKYKCPNCGCMFSLANYSGNEANEMHLPDKIAPRGRYKNSLHKEMLGAY